jgi:NADH:ubiquinone reductase (H+-translocating)
MLYQVATCGILPYDIAIPLRPFSTCRGIEFRRALVEVIDFDHQIVKCDTGDIAYDFLIVALGSTTNYFGNTSAGRHALPVKSLEEGLAIRNRVIDALERATVASVYEARQRLLTFMVIGGGATGVDGGRVG